MVAAAGLGLLIGVVIGGLGGGGGVLTVPVLVYLLGQTAQDATTSSVIIVGITAVAGALARVRGGVAWGTALAFGAVGIPAAYLGTRLNQHAAEPVLLLSFAGLTMVAATAMLLNGRGHDEAEPDRDDQEAAEREGPASATLLTTRPTVRAPRRIASGVKVVTCGLAVGFLTGFLGVGGGFLVVPALVIALRMPMTLAIGTSLMIIGLNSVSSFIPRLGVVAELDWHVIVPFTVAAIVGTIAGKRVSDRFSGTTLSRAFAVLLVVVGGFVAVESLVAL
jgi:uncharacterized membrane protein YfcA